MKTIKIRSSDLHILAMALMFCDHLWSMVLPNFTWLTCIGRIAYPLFAFLLAEGYRHTHNIRKYLLRMLLFALVTEIPFDLMYWGSAFYPYHQNVLWTFLIALLVMLAIDRIQAKGKLWLTVLGASCAILTGFLGALLFKSDYFGTGVLMVLIFYFFPGKKWWCLLGQFLCMYYLNVEVLGGFYYPITILGHNFELIQQGFAMLALIPIWLYNGEQGYRAKWFQYFCYAFYPAHMLLLYLIGWLAFT